MSKRKRKSRQSQARAAIIALPEVRRVPAPAHVTPDRRWRVAVVRPGKDFAVAAELDRLGGATFIPHTVRSLRRGACGRTIERASCLMPGYVLSSLDAPALDLERVDGFRGWLQSDDAPAVLPWGAVRRLVEYLAAPVVTGWRPSIGDLVTVQTGALEGRTLMVAAVDRGSVVALHHDKRVSLAIDLLRAA